MSRLFGWDYPPGAENDPRAPWNQKDEPEFEYSEDGVCEQCGAGGSEVAVKLNDDHICEECFIQNQEDNDE